MYFVNADSTLLIGFFFKTLFGIVNGRMSKKLFKTIILINLCISGLRSSQFLNLPQSRLPTLPGIGSDHQPVVEALSPVHASTFTNVCMLEDTVITSFCTGHVAAPNKVPACGCLLSQRLSVFAGERLPMVCFDAWGRRSPCHLHCLGSRHTDVCTRLSHHSALDILLPSTTSMPVVVCFPTGLLILLGASPKGLF